VELELHANVSKYLVLGRFLAGERKLLDGPRRVWLRHHLFHKRDYGDDDPSVRRRYQDAARFALRFLDAQQSCPVDSRVGALRRFHRASLNGKLAMIAAA